MDISMIVMGKPLWIWASFFGIILFFLAFDLGVFHRKDHVISIKESVYMSVFYITLGLAYGVFVGYQMGIQSAEEYFTGFLLEKSLAVDNIFIISLIFTGLSIPREYQYRVLFYGILGVIILRGIMIASGSFLIHRFEWILYFFGAFLILTGLKLLFSKEKLVEMDENRLLKFLQKHLRVTKNFEGHSFFVMRPHPKQPNKIVLWCTPLFIALLMIEFIDVVFAVDSIPAIFAITKDPYIVYTCNIFAVLGLRALYFALADIIYRFHYLKYALALILVFIGSKIFISDLLGWDKFPARVSLLITVGLLFFGIVYSLYKTKKS
jgi:tellurite resistance protein TerC